jgi:alkylhydroperoxidase family enzyme
MRITPLDPPFPDDVAPTLAKMMPGGVPPIALFRTFAHNPAMTHGVHAWGSYYLSRQSSLDLRTRELVIDRTAARCGCEYEWGVHITFFAERVGLTEDQVRSLAVGGAADPCWTDERDRLAIRLVDELHETSTLGDELWRRLSDAFEVPQLLDMMLLTGWYHAISYVARGADLDFEPGAARFADVG